jgi:DNA polymerase-3 subunit alpha
VSQPFVHLHLHTQYSLLDGAIQHAPLFERAKSLGMPAVAMTDHGNLFGAIEFYEKALAAGVKPILGCEVYVAAGSRFDKEKREKDASGFDAISHLTLLAMDETGYRNLVYLVSKAYLEGFYYKPRIDLDLLRERSAGLIATSGCLSSLVSRAITAGQAESAWRMVEDFSQIFDGRYYLELQRHGIADQDRVNAELLKMAADLRLPLVATNDAHYLGCDDHEPHEALLCIGTGTTLEDPKRFRFDGRGFYVKSGDEMAEVFRDHPSAIANTLEIAERCKLEIELGKFHLPEFQVPLGTTREAVLRDQAWAGLRERLRVAPDEPFDPKKHGEYVARMEHELKVIEGTGFAGYFLIVGDFIGYARRSGIPVGPGRGSSAGSLVAYGLGITGVDPIEYDIIFERFLNPERVSMPDIDVDFCIRGRDEVIRYVAQKYDGEGADARRVSQIITFGKLQAKAAIRDVGRVLGMAYGDVDRIAKLVPDTLGISLDEALAQSPELRARVEADGTVAKLIETARKLEGLSRHASTHAAGVVIANKPLIETVPLYRDPKNPDALVTQYDMRCIERVGLVKFDFLGLKTLTLIADTEKLLRAGGEPAFSIDTIPLDDPTTYELLSRGDTDGVFQVESGGMTDLVVKLRPRGFKELIPIVALYRPGPLGSGMVEDFISRKHGMTKVEYLLPELEELTAETLGVIVYQDQVLQIANRLAGYSLGEADLLRRAMGKKKPEEMAKQRERFVSGAKARGVAEKKANEVFDLMAEFAGYGFAKSHSTAYALITYQTAYLKANHPREFLAALLSSETGNHDKLARYVAHARARGIDVLPPDVNASDRDFAVRPEGIRFGLAGVKNVGEGAIEAIVAARGDGPFSDLFDFCARIDGRRVNRRVVESLVKCGAFDGLHANRAAVWAALDVALETGAATQRDREIGQGSLFGAGPAATAAAPQLADTPPWTERERLAGEKEVLGFYVTGHPLGAFAGPLQRYCDTTASQTEGKAGREVRVGGLVTALREIRTQKGKPMGFATLEDLEGAFELVIFPDGWAQFGAAVKRHHEKVDSGSAEPLLVTGTLEAGDTPKVLVREIVEFERAEERLASQLHLRIVAGDATRDRMLALKKLLAEYAGECTVIVHILIPGESETVLEAGSVRPVDALLRDVDALFGRPVTGLAF